MHYPEEYLARAEMCISLARSAHGADIKSTFLALAIQWRELADILERHRRTSNVGDFFPSNWHE